MYMTTKSGRKLKVPTDEEDAKIIAAAESDPDARPWTGEELAQVKQVQRGQLKNSDTQASILCKDLHIGACVLSVHNH